MEIIFVLLQQRTFYFILFNVLFVRRSRENFIFVEITPLGFASAQELA